ncbi:hypothetical protein CYMTET_42809 [Cymbomonas tetramitiformis]|uniref:RNase H type-1 domain-containing protein n=1 Tax=Cymbomonas tetramitiformis TaxID=36881 RepID=A0AAE0C541_9CHLO|nr:hypothetical protein CYMTET_42809 [Cymbomonas tetramitiformis]
MTEWDKDCVIDPAPSTTHELPELYSLPKDDLEKEVNEIIDRWTEERKREEGHGVEKVGSRPSVKTVVEANTTWSRGKISEDAHRRWAQRLKGSERAAEELTTSTVQREGSEEQNEEPKARDWWGENGKEYPRPERKFDRLGMIYTDGSQRKVETQWGDKEDVTVAGVWDPRKGRNKEHMQSWQGQCQTVNRAELTAILMALMLDENVDEKEVKVCTDSLTSLYQIQNMKRRPHTLERHVHRDILWKILKHTETLDKQGIKVALYKVNAHVGIQGTEKADEVARRACVEGSYELNHDKRKQYDWLPAVQPQENNWTGGKQF